MYLHQYELKGNGFFLRKIVSQKRVRFFLNEMKMQNYILTASKYEI